MLRDPTAARRIADTPPLRRELTEEPERAVVADRKLLRVAIGCMSQWTFEQMHGTYRLAEPELVGYLLRLDKVGVIEMRPLNRYRLRVDKTFRWRPDGPLMRYFREHVVADHDGGGFDSEGEMMMLVHGQIGLSLARAFKPRNRSWTRPSGP